MKPYNVILKAKHPVYPTSEQIGKIVKSKEDGAIVYQFHGAQIMRATNTLGIHPAALDYLMKAGVRRIEFRLPDKMWLWTTPEEVLQYAFIHSFNESHPPHLNLPREHWRKMLPPAYVHVPDRKNFIVELDWVEPETVMGQMEMFK